MKKALTRIRKRNQEVEPLNARITNDTVADHREEVLGKARKYIYPLQHSKHKLVKISLTLFLLAVVAFFTYCTLALYKFQSTSTFLYKVTQVVPFPVARKGSDFVAYENYLFEIKRYTHYYRTQQQLDFNSDAGQRQLTEFKKRALNKVVNDAYIKNIARDKKISVSDREVENRIEMVRSQNRLGASDEEFKTILKDFWNWSENDFKRSLKAQILNEKVVAVLDTETQKRASEAITQIKAGKDFAQLAGEVSEEPASKAAGGDYGFPIEQTNRDINPVVIENLFKLQDGQVSEVINVGYGLEIVKKVQTQPDGKVKASHIVFNFKDINDYLNDIKEKEKSRVYLRLPG